MTADKTVSIQLAAGLMRAVLGPLSDDYPLPSHQGAFVMSKAPHAAFIAGIGSGKSYAGCVRALRAAYGKVGDAVIRTPNLGAVTAPTYQMLQDGPLRTFKEIAGRRIVKFNQTDGLMTMSNGSEILWRSVDEPERLRGANLSWWFGDEAALYDPKTRRLMLGRLRQFGARGWEWIATTPRGQNWVWQSYIRDGVLGERAGYFVQRATSADNPYLAREILDDWATEYSGDFARQELMGEFVAHEGLVYAAFDRTKHVTRDRPKAFVEVVAGVDWGFANPGVMCVVGVDADRRAYVVALEYATRRRIEEWVQVGIQLNQQWGIGAWYCDPSEPTFIQQMQRAGLKAQGADNAVLAGIAAVQNRLAVAGDGRPRLMVTPEAIQMIDEFEQYAWAEGRDGALRDAVKKAKDHSMDALRYVIMGIEQKTKVKVSVSRYA